METNVFKFLWGYARKLKGLCLFSLVAVVLSTVFARSMNYFGAQIVETISQPLPKKEILLTCWGYVFGVFAVLFLQNLIEAVRNLVDIKFIPAYLGRISRQLFSHAHRHSMAFFAEEMAGNISGKIKTIISNAENLYFHLIYGLISPIVGVLTSLAFIATANLWLALIIFLITLFSLILMIKLKLNLAPYAETTSRMGSEANGVLVDSLTNYSLVKNFSNYFYERRHYFGSFKKFILALRREVRQRTFVEFISKFSFTVVNVLFYSLVLLFWYADEISLGGVVLVLSLVGNMVNSVYNISYFTTQFASLTGGMSDGLKLLGRPCEVVDQPRAKTLKVTAGQIVFSDLNYHYKTAVPLFEKFNLEIKAGEKVGLVGRSGSGKSTLVKLLSRYYDLNGGEILVDGQDIRQVTQSSLRKNIALIPQDPSLFNRSIMENIRYGNLRASDEEVYAAARKAYCHDFIQALPQGYESKVGERGVMLSGGERQRIAIARAILKNAPILILDEATSALDSESEKYIQQSLRHLMEGKTVIAIAHRLSTLKEMNKIVVMEHGRIVEQGSHQSLLRKKGLYHSFYDLQALGFLGIGD